MILSSVNTESSQYVLRCGKGLSCIPFEDMHRRAEAAATWMALPAPDAVPGTSEHFAQCAALMDQGQKHASRTRSVCTGNLSAQLIGLEGERVRVIDVNGHCREFYVSTTTGWMPAHLETSTGKGKHGDALAAMHYRSVEILH